MNRRVDYKQLAKDFALEMVRKGKKEFQNLAFEEKALLTGYIMRQMNLYDASEFITQTHKTNEAGSDLAELLIASGLRDSEMLNRMTIELRKSLVSGAISFAEKEIDALLEQSEETVAYVNKYEGGGYDSSYQHATAA